MTTKRFMTDDCGTLIDMHTRDTFDYVSDVCDLLNGQHETIQRLKQNITELMQVDVEEELLKENKRLKSDLARVIEQAKKNDEFCRYDIRILENALWCPNCANDIKRLKELKKEFLE